MDVYKHRDGKRQQRYLSLLLCESTMSHLSRWPISGAGRKYQLLWQHPSPPHPLLFSSIWAMKIKANEILLMHKMRMGKAHSSTWWHSINWWLLNSSLFVPAAALLDWDNMRVPVTALATGLSMCACVCVQPDLNTTHPLLGAFWCFLDLIWPAWETFWICVTTIAFKFKYFIQNSRAYLRMHYIRWTLQLCARSRRPAPARLSCLGNLGRWLLVNSWCCL